MVLNNLWKEFFIQVTKVKPTGTSEEEPIQLSVKEKSPEHACNSSTSKTEVGGSVRVSLGYKRSCLKTKTVTNKRLQSPRKETHLKSE